MKERRNLASSTTVRGHFVYWASVDSDRCACNLRKRLRTYRFPRRGKSWFLQQASDSRSRQHYDECLEPGPGHV